MSILQKNQDSSLNLNLDHLKLLLAEENFVDAINLSLDLLLTESKDSREIIDMLSFAFFKRELIGASLACQSKLLKLNPAHVRAYQNKIVLYQCLLKQKNEHLAHFASAITSNPKVSLNVDKVIILCGGDSSRWQGYLGVIHKPLIPLNGERLLVKTIRQVRTYFSGEIDVLIRSGENAHYEKFLPDENIKLISISRSKSRIENPAAKYLASLPYFSKVGTTVILLGDVWFSDSAIESIFTKTNRSWLSFGRYHPSTCTGYPYGNFFAVRFPSHDDKKSSLILLDRLYKSSICTAHGAGWAWTQLNRNEDPNIRSPGQNFIDINDFTDDFDCPSDYERWIKHFKMVHQ